MITVYAIKNPDKSVSVFRDPAGLRHFAMFDRYNSSKPRKNSRFVTINCYRWALEWINS